MVSKRTVYDILFPLCALLTSLGLIDVSHYKPIEIIFIVIGLVIIPSIMFLESTYRHVYHRKSREE